MQYSGKNMDREESIKTAAAENDDHCFCCGVKNEKGLKLTFDTLNETTVATSLEVPDYFTGWANLTHGGLISMLLDETMAQACIEKGLKGFTAELTVRFIKPLPVKTFVTVEGRIDELKRRIARTSGSVKDSEGTVYAEGKARFIRAE